MGLYALGYALIDIAEKYLLDQGAAYLYQLYDAYAPDGPSLSQIQGFKSGNHAGNDVITFSLHGYSCVYTYRTITFSSYVAGVSVFVRGSSSTGYYQGVADKYLDTRSWLLNNAPNYPIINYKGYEDTYSYGDLLKRHVCYQATLDQMANNTMGAAIDPQWYEHKNVVRWEEKSDIVEDHHGSVSWTLVSTLTFTPASSEMLHLMWVGLAVYIKHYAGHEGEGCGYYKITYQRAGEDEVTLVGQTTVTDTTYSTKLHASDIWGKNGQAITIKFYTATYAIQEIYSKNYYAYCDIAQKWNWNNWYNNITRASFAGSSLRIDNYENSLYMGTVQGYIQGLEQGSITKNCTFIIIKASPTTFSWEDNKPTLTRMISYKAPDGKYYTTVTKIQGDIYGTGPKDIKVDLYEPTPQPFDINGDKWLGVILTVPGVVTYFAWAADAHTILAVFEPIEVTGINLVFVAVHKDVGGLVKAVGIPVWKILAKYAPIPAGPLACIQVALAAFIVADLAYAISLAAGMPGEGCLINSIGGGLIGAGLFLVTSKTIAAALGLSLATLTTIGWICIGVGIVIIIITVVVWWFFFR